MIRIMCECEKCGKIWDGLDPENEQLWELRIVRQCVRSQGRDVTALAPSGENALPDAPEQQWCRACMVQDGLLPAVGKEPKVEIEDPDKKLGEMIRAIISEAVEESCLE